jgi:hypothetical protein
MVFAPMRASLRLPLPLIGAVVLVAGGCGSSKGVPDGRFVDALNLKTVQGSYAIGGNPFCSISKLLHDSGEVQDAAASGRVLASSDRTIGIQVITPFAPSCQKQAQKKLDKLAKKG